MTPTPDRTYVDGKLVAARRSNSSLEAEARCTTTSVDEPRPYVPEFGDVRLMRPVFGRARYGNDCGRIEVGNEEEVA